MKRKIKIKILLMSCIATLITICLSNTVFAESTTIQSAAGDRRFCAGQWSTPDKPGRFPGLSRIIPEKFTCRKF